MDPAAQEQAESEKQQQQQQRSNVIVNNNLVLLDTPIIHHSDHCHSHLSTTTDITPAIVASAPEPQGLMDATLSTDITPVQVASAAGQTSGDSDDCCCGDSDGDGDCCIIM